MAANIDPKPIHGPTALADGEVRQIPWPLRLQSAAGGDSPAAHTVPHDEFVAAMGRAVNGVSVVTTDGQAGCWGLTVSAVVSVSADPALLLVCINRRSPLLNALIENGIFSVNLLSAWQREIADTFAGRPANGAAFDFSCAEWCPAMTGAPLLSDAAAAFDCVLNESHDAGTHRMCIGQVVAARSLDVAPLLYSARQYGEPQYFLSA